MKVTLKALRVLLGTALRADPGGTALSILMDVLRGASTVMIGFWLKLLVNAAVSLDRHALVLSAVGLGAFSAVPWLAGGLAGRRNLTVEERVNFYLERRIAEAAWSASGIGHLEHPEYLDRFELLRTRSGGLGGAFGWLVVGVGLVVQAATVAFLLASIDPILLSLFGLGALLLGSEVLSQRRLQRAEEIAAPEERRARHLEALAMLPGPAAELRCYRLERRILELHQEARSRAHRARVRAQRQGAAYAAAAGAAFGAGVGGALWLTLAHALRGKSTAGDVILLLSLAASTRDTVFSVARTLSGILDGLRTARRFVLLLEEFEKARPHPALASVPTRLETSIRLQAVSFRYPGSERMVLKDVSMLLPSGRVVALVGENGAGKTTIVKLILRLYEPTEGSIRVDGIDLRDLDPHVWRSRCSGAFQDFWRPELALQEAVGIGDPPNIHRRDAVLNAVSRAGGDALLAAMPRGLDTQLGARWEGGLEPSTGQWQTLALARGFMRAETLLLVVDEPTAALDAAAEHALFERIASEARTRGRGLVTLLISHRFSTVRTADLIYVVSEGRIVEWGGHDQLMATGGLYAELYALQARSYR